MASAKSPDRWKARLLEGGSAALTYALVRAEVSFPAEVAPVRLQGSVASVGAGVVFPLGCRPSWTTGMELSAEYLREKLQRDLEAEHVEVEDTTLNRCACSFRVLVVSAKFEGKPLLQRHRLVNACLAEELPHIHAFEQKTLTPEQWARERQK
ncbi:PREDICTED: bolA-like protein 2 [Colobus angolensis palliatus]|uniref:BolA-like protein 2 n=1 Tax=Colobus angolensis palliatus TaxID=336983 RepID=A0A2K5KE80_COLAP|nr:PREDICTED: bolA-like protein 2 [Colobus angolensis palliatus]